MYQYDKGIKSPIEIGTCKLNRHTVFGDFCGHEQNLLSSPNVLFKLPDSFSKEYFKG